MISFKQKGPKWSKTFKFLDNILNKKYINILDKYAKLGLIELENATPVDTGKTKNSWYYDISYKVNERGYKEYSITWFNKNVIDGANVAVLLQYGHATRSGSYVEGIDYINPALEPIFEKFANAAWEEVNKA